MQRRTLLMRHKGVWAACMIAAVGIWLVWNQPTSDEDIRETEIPWQGNALDLASRTTLPSRNESNRLPQISHKLTALLDFMVIEEDTGEISPRFFKIFHIPQEDIIHTKQLISQAIEEFKKIEAEKAEAVSTPEDVYIRLNDCSKESQEIFHRLAEELSSSIGTQAAESICALINRQFRDGGREFMEIGVVQTGDGQYLLSKRSFYPNGSEKSVIESTYLISGEVSELARWRNLRQLLQPGTTSLPNDRTEPQLPAEPTR